MSHEIETMAYTGETPWHKLGQAVSAGLTLDEAIKACGLDWSVELRALFTSDGTLVDDSMATVRMTDGKVLGVVGDEYGVLQNRDAFEAGLGPILAAGEATFESGGSLRGGRRVWMLARIKGAVADVVPGDPVEGFLLVSNSHDGSMAARFGTTRTRVVCQNTLDAAHDDRSSSLIRIYHKGDVKETLQAVAELMNVERQNFEADIESFRRLASKPLHIGDLAKYVRKVFSAKRKTVKRTVAEFEAIGSSMLDECLAAIPRPEEDEHTRLVQTIERLAEEGRGVEVEGVMGTWWGAYNAVTEYLTHERGRSADTRRDSLWFGQSASLNHRALQLALDATD